jgi:hypothetical protein
MSRTVLSVARSRHVSPLVLEKYVFELMVLCDGDITDIP